jgi:TP901 family phage tail tape measure protein
MSEFIVDFSKSLSELAEFQLRLSGLGAKLDELEKSGKKPGSAATEMLRSMDAVYKKIEATLTNLGVESEDLGRRMKGVRDGTLALFSGIAAANAKTNLTYDAVTGKLGEVNKLLADTASKNAYISSMQRINMLNESMVNNNNELRAKIEALNTEEGKLNVQLREQYALAQQALRAQKTEISQRDQLIQKLRQLDSAEGQEIANLKEEVRAREQAVTATAQMVTENQKLRSVREGLDTELGQENAQLREQIRLREQEVTAIDRLVTENAKLRAAKEALDSELGQENSLLRQGIRNREQEVQFTSAQIGAIQRLNMEYQSLNGGLGESIARQTQLNNARREEITEDQRLAIEIERVKRSIESLNGGLAEQLQALKAVEGQRRKQINDANTERQVIDEVTAALKREEDQLRQLQAQADLLSGPNGKRVTLLRNEIAEQTRLNKLRAMSTGELLGFGKSQREMNIAQEVGSQSTAMMRAGLTGLHASVGMYTSATVLAATGTYAFTAALRDSIITGAEFQATMSRTRAVMSSGENGIGVNDESFKALEAQVRALGQTTVFTASEVANGLQQLGMAGFSASDAMTALPATLQLANLANVDMGKSADIATNVLMTFSMEAKELQGVVDLMATAVNNSNADIDQLATTLKYAGPAAHTAGISLQETVAAAEALANSGIKGSNAGSALRRLFVSLLNPTKKGAAMMDQYGISVLDAQGNTRSLVDIIGQLNKALSGLSGADRLTAIQNLVGVYATSSVSALVDQYKNFEQFANQNANVDGAGDRMEKIISDNLQFDWKAMLSALEELQLTAFDSMNGRLRELVNSISLEVLGLMEPVNTVFSKELGKDIQITGLDRLIQQMETLATVGGYAIAGFAAFKLSGGALGGALTAVATDLGGKNGLSDRLRELQTRMSVAEQGQGLLGRSMEAGKARFTALRAEITATTGAMGYATLATRGLIGTLNGLAVAGAFVAKAFGWVGLVYGIGSAVYSLFSTDTDAEVLKHKEGVDATRESYSKMRDEIEKAGLAKQRAAMADQVKVDEGIVTDLKGKIATTQSTIKKGEDVGLSEAGLKGQREYLESLEAQLKKYESKLIDTKAQLGTLEETNESYSKSMDDQLPLIEAVTKATNDLAQARMNLMNLGVTDAQGLADMTDAERVVLAAAREKAENFGKTAVNIRPTTTSYQQLKDQDELIAGIEAEEAAYKATATESQKLADVRGKLSAVYEEETKLIAANAKALEGIDEENSPGLDDWRNNQKKKVELLAEQKELAAKVTDQMDKLRLAEQKGASVTRGDEENNKANRQRIAELNKELEAVSNPTDGSAVDLEKKTALINERTSLQQELNAIEKRADSASKRSTRGVDKAAREAEQLAKSDLATYTSLAKKFDEVSASQLEMNKGIEAMSRLRKGQIIDGKMVSITAEQESKALVELRKQHYLATQQADEHLKAATDLMAKYSGSTFSEAAADLATLNEQFALGNISMTQYNATLDQIASRNVEGLKESLPKAQIPTGTASSTIFSDFASTAVTYSDDMKTFDKQQETLNAQVALQQATNLQILADKREMYDAIYKDRDQHDAKMLEAQNKYNSDSKGLEVLSAAQQKTITDQRLQYQKDQQTLIFASSLGTIGEVMGMFASASKDASSAQKAAFAIQKAIAVAQIILYTEVAATRAGAEMGIGGIALATYIRASGYASAGLVAALAIGSLATGSDMSGSASGGGAKMYDTGGTIPYNRVGIVGEYGPELVSGPANVKGRTATAAQSDVAAAGERPSITLAPVFQVTAPGADQDSQKAAADFARLSSGLFIKHMEEAMRNNGMLDNWYRNQRKA